MKENTVTLQQRLEKQIDESRLSEQDKEYMKRIVDGIIKAPKGRLYLINNPDFQRYMTLRKDVSDLNSSLDYCLVNVMKNPDTGFTEGRSYTFPGLKGFLRLARENESVLASELVNSQNHQKVKSGVSSSEITAPKETEEQRCKRLTKESIARLETVPDYKKQRVYDALDMIDKIGKIKAVDEQDYSEHIAMRRDGGILGYCLVQRMIDYSGATVGRRYVMLGAKTLVAYVEEHREIIDKEVKKAQELDR